MTLTNKLSGKCGFIETLVCARYKSQWAKCIEHQSSWPGSLITKPTIYNPCLNIYLFPTANVPFRRALKTELAETQIITLLTAVYFICMLPFLPLLGKILVTRTTKSGACTLSLAALTCVRISSSFFCLCHLIMKASQPYYADQDSSV